MNIPYSEVVSEITEFLEGFDREYRPGKYIIGLSGGLDSSVTLALLVKALSPEKVLGIIAPDSRSTPPGDVKDAVSLAKALGIEYRVFYIDEIVDSYRVIPDFEFEEGLALGNLRARVRMNALYYYANKLNGIVVGTSDRSELLIGYFTKFGDGAADIHPIAPLYKLQVRALGEYLGLPSNIVGKPSAPYLWRGHTAEKELGARYEEIDVVLYALFDLGIPPQKVPEATGVPAELVKKIIDMHVRSRHKRRLINAPRLRIAPEPIRELGSDISWRERDM